MPDRRGRRHELARERDAAVLTFVERHGDAGVTTGQVRSALGLTTGQAETSLARLRRAGRVTPQKTRPEKHVGLLIWRRATRDDAPSPPPSMTSTTARTAATPVLDGDAVAGVIMRLLREHHARGEALARATLVAALPRVHAAMLARTLRDLTRRDLVRHEVLHDEFVGVQHIYHLLDGPRRAVVLKGAAVAPTGCSDPHCPCPVRSTDFAVVRGQLVRVVCRRDECATTTRFPDDEEDACSN